MLISVSSYNYVARKSRCRSKYRMQNLAPLQVRFLREQDVRIKKKTRPSQQMNGFFFLNKYEITLP